MNFSPELSPGYRANDGQHRILVAGVGNIFLGDDAFGCEVINELAKRPLLPTVLVQDFGIRSYDLACALGDDFDAIILVDAIARDAAPGSIFVIEPETTTEGANFPASMDPHELNVMRALQSAQAHGPLTAQVCLVGCVPATLDTEEGAQGLSEPLRAALPVAVATIEKLIANILEQEAAGAEIVQPGEHA